MNIYPEQLVQIEKMIEVLNAASNASEQNGADVLPYAIPVMDNENDYLLGYVVDEIGGEFSFVPLGTPMADYARKTIKECLEKDWTSE